MKKIYTHAFYHIANSTQFQFVRLILVHSFAFFHRIASICSGFRLFSFHRYWNNLTKILSSTHNYFWNINNIYDLAIHFICGGLSAFFRLIYFNRHRFLFPVPSFLRLHTLPFKSLISTAFFQTKCRVSVENFPKLTPKTGYEKNSVASKLSSSSVSPFLSALSVCINEFYILFAWVHHQTQ